MQKSHGLSVDGYSSTCREPDLLT